jgi:hypothetical protein
LVDSTKGNAGKNQHSKGVTDGAAPELLPWVKIIVHAE